VTGACSKLAWKPYASSSAGIAMASMPGPSNGAAFAYAFGSCVGVPATGSAGAAGGLGQMLGVRAGNAEVAPDQNGSPASAIGAGVGRRAAGAGREGSAARGSMTNSAAGVPTSSQPIDDATDGASHPPSNAIGSGPERPHGSWSWAATIIAARGAASTVAVSA
jgi:hypothetical protein